jgi:hypothetical protein
LVDVDRFAAARAAGAVEADVAAGGADVAKGYRHAAAQLVLDVNRILVDLWIALVLIDIVDCAATPVSSPSELPNGTCKPPGNGLSSATVGTAVVLSDCTRFVVA